MTRPISSIKTIVEGGLCTGCGICAGVCPVSAITMREFQGLFLPTINVSKCIECKICNKCCPGYEVNFKELNDKIFGNQTRDPLLGNCICCYSGYSTDADVRFNASSGGVVTQLLVNALESHLIDGALIVRMNEKNPLEPEVFIARNKEEIIASSKSKYCPVTIHAGLAEILNESGRFAVVGLPCHIQGIRKAQLTNKLLDVRIVLIIGLICARETSFEGTRFLLKSIKVPEDSIKRLEYRGKGWPGGLTINLKGGKEIFMPFAEYRTILGSLPFTPQRCLLCNDPLNELADITIGDAWLAQFNEDKKGKSIVICRSKRGYEILKGANHFGQVKLEPLSKREALQSQKKLIDFKKVELPSRFSVWASFGRSIPNYIVDYPQLHQSKISQTPRAVAYYVVTKISSEPSKLSKLLLYFFRFSAPVIVKTFYLRYGNSSPYWTKSNRVSRTK